MVNPKLTRVERVAVRIRNIQESIEEQYALLEQLEESFNECANVGDTYGADDARDERGKVQSRIATLEESLDAARAEFKAITCGI